MREINLTPIPAAEYRPGHETDEIDLICRECDLNFHAQGVSLSGLVEVVDQAHEQRHQREGGGA